MCAVHNNNDESIAVRQRYLPYILMHGRDQRCACIALVAMKVTSVMRNDLLADILPKCHMKTAVASSTAHTQCHVDLQYM